jgi:hypothetical protein
MEKKERIEDILNSGKQLRRAEAPDGLWAKIQQEIQQEAKVIALVPKRTVWIAAASVTALIVLNWFALQNYVQNSNESSAVDMLIEQYQLE